MDGKDEPYIAIFQDRREAPRNRHERGKDIREFFHRGWLGYGILSGLLGRVLFIGAFALFSAESKPSPAGIAAFCADEGD